MSQSLRLPAACFVLAIVVVVAYVFRPTADSTVTPAARPAMHESGTSQNDAPIPNVDRVSDETTPDDTTLEDDVQPSSQLVSAPVAFATSSTVRQSVVDQNLLSAEKDGWDTEHYAELASKALKSLIAALVKESHSTRDVKGTVSLTALRPEDLSEVFHDEFITVRRLEDAGGLRSEPIDSSRLVAELRKSIPFPTLNDFHWHVKIISVDLSNSAISTSAIIELANVSNEISWQANANWDCTWKLDPDGAISLTAIQLKSYQESEVRTKDEKWFSDRTQDVIGQNDAYQQQLQFGHHYWLQRIERSHRFDTSVRNGLAVGDVNGDGLDDVYVCQPPALPNLLFVHQGDGTAQEQASQAGIDWLDQSSGAIFCDLDNDGDQDLLVGTPTGTLVMANDSTGKFSRQAVLEHDYDVQSLSVVDFDNDGLLDVFVCIYRTATPPPNQHFLYRDAVGGGQNRLYRNTTHDGHLSFVNVTEAVGLTDGADRYTLAASWEDFDNDGDQDLYVANDFGRNYLYRNDNGQFTNVAPSAGVEDIGSGMSVGWGDYDRDGLMDLYVGNMFSSAGSRVTAQPGFRIGEDDEIRQIYQRLAKGNSLFRNQGGGRFTEVGAAAGVELGRWAWSSLFADLNNDGWEDLFVANGYITTPDTGDL